MTEVLIFSPETSDEMMIPEPSRSEGSDSRTESDGEPEQPDAWMEAEENDADDEEEEDEEEEEEAEENDADDEEEEDEEEEAEENDADDEEEEEDRLKQAFTPNVMILQSTGQEHTQMEKIPMEKIPMDENFSNPPQLFQPDTPEDSSCVEVVRVCVCVMAAALMFPLLTWAGYKLLPFEAPPLDSTPLRLIYTLRCAFFASVPIVLGVLVQGVSRLRFGTLTPLFDGSWENRKVVVHGRFVRDSLHLHLLFFLQLAVMATYAQPDLLKLVPLLTIVFVLGRLIYWVCVAFGSSVRALGLALSFLPLLVLLGANLYFIGSVGGPEAVFDVAPPTTAPPPKLRWWR